MDRAQSRKSLNSLVSGIPKRSPDLRGAARAHNDLRACPCSRDTQRGSGLGWAQNGSHSGQNETVQMTAFPPSARSGRLGRASKGLALGLAREVEQGDSQTS